MGGLSVTFRTSDLVRAGVFLIIAGLCLFALAGCAHTSEAPAYAVTPLRMFGVNVDGAALARHEALADTAFKRHTGASLASLSGWTVERRTDATWQEKYERLGFFDGDYNEGRALWGLTLRDEKKPPFRKLTIYVADENYASANLAHEFCHALFPVADHPDWPRLGCDKAEEEVRQAMTVPVLRVMR